MHKNVSFYAMKRTVREHACWHACCYLKTKRFFCFKKATSMLTSMIPITTGIPVINGFRGACLCRSACISRWPLWELSGRPFGRFLGHHSGVPLPARYSRDRSRREQRRRKPCQNAPPPYFSDPGVEHTNTKRSCGQVRFLVENILSFTSDAQTGIKFIDRLAQPDSLGINSIRLHNGRSPWVAAQWTSTAG